jgi:hypothetical protein
MTAEELIDNIEQDCSSISNEIIDKVCRRAMRTMNSKLGFLVEDDYPNNFKFIDYLSCEIQSKTYDEIFFPGKLLEDYIEEVLDNEYENLTGIEKIILSYSNFRPQFGSGYEFCDIRPFIYPRFRELLNEHWDTSKKIQHFEETKNW